MKRLLIILIIACMLLCVGCKEDTAVPTTSQTITENTENAEPVQLPRGLEGEWMSATPGERGYTESITFAADGTLTVSSLKDGAVQQTIQGTFYVDGDRIIYEINDGTSPYSGEYRYSLDGRELYLMDDDGAAHYLRTS